MVWDIKVWHLLFETARIWSILIIVGSFLVLAEKKSKCPEETPVHSDKRLKEHLSFKYLDASESQQRRLRNKISTEYILISFLCKWLEPQHPVHHKAGPSCLSVLAYASGNQKNQQSHHFPNSIRFIKHVFKSFSPWLPNVAVQDLINNLAVYFLK